MAEKVKKAFNCAARNIDIVKTFYTNHSNVEAPALASIFLCFLHKELFKGSSGKYMIIAQKSSHI